MIHLDPAGPGFRFDGVGALSNSSSRLLLDYPEAARDEILDYLFLPRYGASLQLLKLEVGADTNSTTTAEPSHLRTPSDLEPDAGWNWWIAKEARARNPELWICGLMWGAPGWFEGGMWSGDHVRYLLRWLECADRNGIRVDYLGGGNEWYDPAPSAEFFVALKRALATDHPHVQLIATDSHSAPDYWWLARDMRTNPELAAAVDILGEHDVCVWRSEYRHCHVDADARHWRELGKPIWNSEQSSQDAEAAAPALARAMNRQYVEGRVTGSMYWPAVAAFYGNTATGGTGLMVAEWPWSGHYRVPPSVWAIAHTSQFVAPGWRYLDDACGYTSTGSSYVALHDPDGDAYSVIVETLDATGPEALSFAMSEDLAAGPVHVWSTDLTSTDPADWFTRQRTLEPTDGRFELPTMPGRIYSLTTTTGQRRGAAGPVGIGGSEVRMPLPYGDPLTEPDSTAGLSSTGLPRYFQDLQGGFEIVPDPDRGAAYRQLIETAPIRWHDSRLPPTTLLGDPFWWGDYELSVACQLERPGAVELLGRVEYYDANVVVGYHFQVRADGGWLLYAPDHDGEQHVVADGHTTFQVGRWHRLRMEFRGHEITLGVDDETLGTVSDRRHTSGQVGLAVGGWYPARFSDLRVRPTVSAPAFAKPERLRAYASSAHERLWEHHTYGPGRVLDGRPETRWMTEIADQPPSEPEPAHFRAGPTEPAVPLPQSLTLDLGTPTPVYGVVYKPSVHRLTRNTVITAYALEVSDDGEAYEPIRSGRFEPTIATKPVPLAEPVQARYVRLVALESGSGIAAACALDVALSPIPSWWQV